MSRTGNRPAPPSVSLLGVLLATVVTGTTGNTRKAAPRRRAYERLSAGRGQPPT